MALRAAGAGLSVALPDGTAVVRRVIDADNSCLFNAVGYVMEGSRSRAPELRYRIHPLQRRRLGLDLVWNLAPSKLSLK